MSTPTSLQSASESKFRCHINNEIINSNERSNISFSYLQRNDPSKKTTATFTENETKENSQYPKQNRKLQQLPPEYLSTLKRIEKLEHRIIGPPLSHFTCCHNSDRPLPIQSRNMGNESSMTHLLVKHQHSVSHHSFSFGGVTPEMHKDFTSSPEYIKVPQPNTSLRVTSPSLRGVHMAAEVHIRKLTNTLAQIPTNIVSKSSSEIDTRYACGGNFFRDKARHVTSSSVKHHDTRNSSSVNLSVLPQGVDIPSISSTGEHTFRRTMTTYEEGHPSSMLHPDEFPSSVSVTNFSTNSASQTLITAHVHLKGENYLPHFNHSKHRDKKYTINQSGIETKHDRKSVSIKGRPIISNSPPLLTDVLHSDHNMNSIPTLLTSTELNMEERQILQDKVFSNAVEKKRKNFINGNNTPKKRNTSINSGHVTITSLKEIEVESHCSTKKKRYLKIDDLESTSSEVYNAKNVNANISSTRDEDILFPSSASTRISTCSPCRPCINHNNSKTASSVVNKPGLSVRYITSFFPTLSSTTKLKNIKMITKSYTEAFNACNDFSQNNLGRPPIYKSSSSVTTTFHRENQILQLRKEISTLNDLVSSLRSQLADRDAQLKAVSNNRTIIHSSLKYALELRNSEFAKLQSSSSRYKSLAVELMEQLVRSDSRREADEIRRKLAGDSARLGRVVYNRVGIHTVEGWEEGELGRELKRRKSKLRRRREILEQQQNDANCSVEELKTRKHDPLERENFIESLTVRLGELAREELDLRKEEENLHAEKSAYIRSWKRVGSEDCSRFKNRPKLHDRYVLLSQLGKGGFSEVWRAFDLTELRDVAVKIHQLDPSWSDAKIDNYTKHVAREYEIHRDVRHPRIVSLYDVFEIDANSFATVLECCKGTDLDTLLKQRKTLSERHARSILIQIVSGMKYLSAPDKSRQGIIHYDLKPGNILFDEYGDAKITDFGLSKIMDTSNSGDSMELTSQGAGTYWYLPPECFVTSQNVKISNKVDVWSIGVIFYQMLFGKRPFGDGQSQENVLANNVMLNAREVSFPNTPVVSDECKEFICKCLIYEHSLRPNISEICTESYIKVWNR